MQESDRLEHFRRHKCAVVQSGALFREKSPAFHPELPEQIFISVLRDLLQGLRLGRQRSNHVHIRETNPAAGCIDIDFRLPLHALALYLCMPESGQQKKIAQFLVVFALVFPIWYYMMKERNARKGCCARRFGTSGTLSHRIKEGGCWDEDRFERSGCEAGFHTGSG